jgi:hypothetical protein
MHLCRNGGADSRVSEVATPKSEVHSEKKPAKETDEPTRLWEVEAIFVTEA